MGGHIYRAGKSNSGSRVQLGSVATFASNKRPPQLEMDQLDKISLYPNSDGRFECDLFWEGTPRAAANKSDTTVSYFFDRILIITVSWTLFQKPKAEFELAAVNKSVGLPTGSTTKDELFIQFLRTLLNGRTTEWKTARTA